MSEAQPALRLVRVVGAGLIGTSIGLALRRAGVDVVLADRDPDRVEEAAARGAGRPASAEPAGADLVVVAVPPAATALTVVAELRREVSAIVTHTASVQAQPQREISTSGEDLARFIGSHPIAGRELSGPRAACADLFRDRSWVLCPTPASSPAAVALVGELARCCGARPVTLPADEHDRILAAVSHVPQLVASALAASLISLEPAQAALAGTGVRDTTRLAESDPDLWAEIVAANPRAVAAGVRGVAAPLLALADELDAASAEGAPAVRELVARGRRGRALLPGKHGRAATAWATVEVIVPDEPGALAHLLALVADHQVNLEDLRVEHAPGQPEGTATLAVAAEAQDRLVDVLRGAGWSAMPGSDAAL